jgi:hypothetical protein
MQHRKGTVATAEMRVVQRVAHGMVQRHRKCHKLRCTHSRKRQIRVNDGRREEMPLVLGLKCHLRTRTQANVLRLRRETHGEPQDPSKARSDGTWKQMMKDTACLLPNVSRLASALAVELGRHCYKL